MRTFFGERKSFILIFSLLFAAPASAYRKPLNPHRRKSRVAQVSASTSTVKGETLPPSRWAPEVRAAILKFATERGEGSPGYDPARKPLAVLPFNDFAVLGDPGELVFQRLVREAAFKVSDDFWKEVPLAYGRQRLRAAYEQFGALPSSIWEQQPTYHQFRKGFTQSYQDMCVKLDVKDCRAYLVRLTIGFKEDEFLKYAEETLAQERAKTLSVEEVVDAEGDPAPASARRGLREVPEALALVDFLAAKGVDVWFVELDAQQVLKAAAEGWSVPAERQLAIRQGRSRDRFDGEPIEPIPTRGGKVDAFIEAAGRAPDLMIGRSIGDAELMGYGGVGLRIALTNDPRLVELARKKGWLLQPSF